METIVKVVCPTNLSYGIQTYTIKHYMDKHNIAMFKKAQLLAAWIDGHEKMSCTLKISGIT